MTSCPPGLKPPGYRTEPTRLEDKVAIVTGGGSGIGRGVCLAYAREGAQVVVVDNDLEGANDTVRRLEAVGRRGLAVRTDVSDAVEVDAMVAATLAAFGTVDVLFNGAGITIPASLLDTTVEQWDRILAVNLRGQFLCLRAAARVMVERGHGKIVNVTSILGAQARVNRGAYGASKAGIISLMQTAAVELGPRGIYANAIAPGFIETPMAKSAPATPEETRRKLAAIPLRRRAIPRTGPDRQSSSRPGNPTT
jgi:3-oxoacyl-[acyl-carrier protein] reductase